MREPNELSPVVDMTEDTTVPRGLPAPGLCRLEADDPGAGPHESIRSSQADNPGADDRDGHELPRAPARAATVSGTSR